MDPTNIARGAKSAKLIDEKVRKGKVTFIENEDIEGEGEDGAIDKKNIDSKKAKINIASELDAGLEKLASRFNKLEDPARPKQPWEVDAGGLIFGKVLGKGSYGVVYKGTYNNQEVAVKLMEWGEDIEDDVHSQNLQFRFMREVEMMYKLASHPNVCKFLGASLGSMNFQVPSPIGKSFTPVSTKMCCIVMEFLSGGTLREFWISHRRSGKRRMPFSIMIQFALDIARGVAHLHSKKICHRDLKPDNILLDDNFVLKIADFGVSRIDSDRFEAMTQYTGTPTYTAPEILKGSTSYNYKCDVYSYGICLWEIYTCDCPYPGLTNMETGKMRKSITEHNRRPPIPVCCPSELKFVMTKCWDNDPAQRPEMAQVVQWLTAIDTNKKRLVSDNCVEQSVCVTECVSMTCCGRVS